MTTTAEEVLLAYHWPGNVGELRNAIEQATIVCEGATIDGQHLSLADREDAPSLRSTNLGDLEQQAIEQAMREVARNKARAARKLGISRTQLYGRLRKYERERAAAHTSERSHVRISNGEI